MIADIQAQGVETCLEEIRNELQEGRFRPAPLRRIYIPKKDGRKRGLGIPVLKEPVLALLDERGSNRMG